MTDFLGITRLMGKYIPLGWGSLSLPLLPVSRGIAGRKVFAEPVPQQGLDGVLTWSFRVVPWHTPLPSFMGMHSYLQVAFYLLMQEEL